MVIKLLQKPAIANPMPELRDQFDSPWKDILEAYFQDFVQFFFPQIHTEIDWSRGYDFLDQELLQVVRDAELGKRLADKLVKVWKLSGKEWKFMLTRSLYERGYERQDILNLFRFIDWILELPENLKQSFRDELEAYERENQMPYVTSIERMAEAKGEAKGEKRQKQTIALNLLRKNIPVETISEVTDSQSSNCSNYKPHKLTASISF